MEKLELKAPTAPKTLDEKIKDAVSFIKRAEKLALKMRERERAAYPKYYDLLRKAVASIPLKEFETADDMLDWWFSGLLIKQWRAEHYHQYKLNI